MVVMVADAAGAGAGIAIVEGAVPPLPPTTTAPGATDTGVFPIVVAWPGASDAPPTMIPDGSEGSAEIT